MENLKILNYHIFPQKKTVLSIEKIFKKGESIEILKILGLIKKI